MKPTVIVLHGMLMSSVTMRTITQTLNNNGFDAIAVDYNTLSVNIENLEKRILKLISGKPVVHLVGHSLGGCVCVKLFQRGSIGNSRTKVVTLGSPFSRVDILSWNYPNPFLSIAGDSQIPPSSPFWLLNDRTTLEPNDGIVKVSETQLAGTTHKTFNLDHSKLIHSKEVIESVVEFLK